MIEGERNNSDGLWEIILPSHPKNKTSIQTNNNTTTASYEILYATIIK